jgi:nucleoid DNA-binding protein
MTPQSHSKRLNAEGTGKRKLIGKFTVRKKEPREGRNPRTGEASVVPGRKVVTFRPSALWKAELNAAVQINIKE